jgi:hypothetical protein
VVGRGTPDGVGEGVVDNEELDREITILVGVTVGIDVVVGRRLEDGMRVEVEKDGGMPEDESGVDSTDLVALPSHIN